MVTLDDCPLGPNCCNLGGLLAVGLGVTLRGLLALPLLKLLLLLLLLLPGSLGPPGVLFL